MQLARFRQFLEEIRAHPELGNIVAEFRSFKFYRNHWHNDSDETISDQAQIQTLDRVLLSGEPWRARSSLDTFLPIRALSVILVAQFHTLPRATTTKRALKVANECLRHSNNEFDATHDALTGLLNQPELERKIRSLFVAISMPIQEPGQPTASGARADAIHIFALDVDHFKQCNDSYGHQFGDLVLQVIARRLERFCESLRIQEPKVADVLVSRPHGEEFFVVVAGSFQKSELVQLGDLIRQTIKDIPVPSNEEWQDFSVGHKDFELPHISERRITISIGVTTLSSAPPSLDSGVTPEDQISTSLRHADTALYRAKAGGRDTVRHYADILQQYGTILEHHAETDVVVIDIGNAVGVHKGQEFLIYHPDFSGTKPYYFSDGRSKRKLGTYPRRSNGHIEVFNAQAEISFCRVISRGSGATFVPGSLLEAIPLGSIAHLLSSDPTRPSIDQTDLGTSDQLRAHAATLKANKTPVASCVVTLDAPSTVLKERGTAFVNHALARLYALLSKKFSTNSRIGQVNPTTLAVVGEASEEEGADKKARQILAECANAFSGKAKFVAGAFDQSITNRPALPGDKSELDASRALELASYAVSPDGRGQSDVQLFSPLISSRIVYGARSRRQYDQALKCAFQSCRPPSPKDVGRSFRCMPVTQSEGCRPPLVGA